MKKLVVPVLLLVGGLGTLLAVGISKGAIPELQVAQLTPEAAEKYGDDELKVHGLLDTVESLERPLRFTVRDKDDPEKKIAVRLSEREGRPDTFQTGYDVSVLGHWDAAGKVFNATKLYTKCPSKYEAVEKKGIGSGQAYEAARSAAPGSVPSLPGEEPVPVR